ALSFMGFSPAVVHSVIRVCAEELGSSQRAVLSRHAMGRTAGAGCARVVQSGCGGRCGGVLHLYLPPTRRNPAVAQGIACEASRARRRALIAIVAGTHSISWRGHGM